MVLAPHMPWKLSKVSLVLFLVLSAFVHRGVSFAGVSRSPIEQRTPATTLWTNRESSGDNVFVFTCFPRSGSRCYRRHLGYCPYESSQLSGYCRYHCVVAFASCDQATESGTQSDLALPRDVADFLA